MNPITPAELFAEAEKARPEQCACVYMGRSFSYSELAKMADSCARAFAAIGVHEGCRVMIYMPMLPQSVACFYGLNLLGASAVLIKDDVDPAACIKDAGIRAIVTLDSLYDKLAGIPELPTTIIARPQDAMDGIRKLSYILRKGRKVEKIPEDYGLLNWEGFLLGGKALRGEYRAEAQSDREAAAIYDGGFTLITNGEAARGEGASRIMSIHRALIEGKRCVLSPQ